MVKYNRISVFMLVGVFCVSPIAQGDVAYDNTLTRVAINHGLGLDEGGDQVTLDGACRVVTGLELGFPAGAGSSDLVVRIYANDGPSAAVNLICGGVGDPRSVATPGTLLFDSGTITVPTVAGFNTFMVNVPDITVPDSITWTMQKVDGVALTLFRYDPPTVGSSDDYFFQRTGTTWIAKDCDFAEGGIADSFYGKVIVSDGGALNIECPADVVLNCGDDSSPQATGNAVSTGCTEGTISSTDSSTLACGNTETITRLWNIDDGAGGSTSCTQTITIADSAAPSLANVPVDESVECDAIPDVAPVTATDDCDASPVVSFSETQISGSCPNSFLLMRTWTAEDACGNSVSTDQVIGVADTTPPTIICPADALSLECPSDTSISAHGSATATDACGSTTLTSADVSVPGLGGSEVITRTWTATDACGQSSNCDQVIEVVDTLAPSVSCSVVTDTLWSPNHELTNVELSVTVTDQCDTSEIGTVTLEVWSDETEIPDTGDGTGRFAPDAKDFDMGLRLRNERRAKEEGRVYLIVARVEDNSGNVGFGTCSVVVPHDQTTESANDVAAEAANAAATFANTPGNTIAEKIAGLVNLGWTQHGISGELGNKQ